MDGDTSPSEKLLEEATNGLKYLTVDEIKKMLSIPEFPGIDVKPCPDNVLEITLPLKQTNDKKVNSSSPDFSNIPECLKRTSSETSAGGNLSNGDDTNQEGSSGDNEMSKLKSLLDPDLLSGYDIYLKEFATPMGELSVTHQSTLSLRLPHNLQVDISIDNAIRILNPETCVALAVDGSGSRVAIMHPVGRVLMENELAHLFAPDFSFGSHRIAMLWPEKSIFSTVDSRLAYVIDETGTRTTARKRFTNITCRDITMSVFYGTSHHGSFYKAEAKKILYSTSKGVEPNGCNVWQIGETTVTYLHGEVRVKKPPVLLRTSAATGQLGVITSKLYCTASQTEMPHLFVRNGNSKVHYNTMDFRLRTLDHAAGIDTNSKFLFY